MIAVTLMALLVVALALVLWARDRAVEKSYQQLYANKLELEKIRLSRIALPKNGLHRSSEEAHLRGE